MYFGTLTDMDVGEGAYRTYLQRSRTTSVELRSGLRQ